MKRIYIEITNQCNLHCSFCPITSRNKREMKTEEFEYILRQTSLLTPYIYLHVQGEPLFHRHLENLLNICDSNHQHLQLVTNGTYISKYPMLYKHLSIRRISFSFQSIEFQNQIHIKDYIHHIDTFSKNARQNRDDIYIEYRFWRDDQLNLPNTKYAYEYLVNHYNFKPTNRLNSYQLDERLFLSYENTFDWPSIDNNNDSSIGTCLGTIQQLAILVDGTVVPCCLDYNSSIPLGNIFHESLSTIMHSERFLRIQNGFKNHRVVEELCKHCTFKNRFIKEELK